MVSTRGHPQESPEPAAADLTPSKSSSSARKSSSNTTTTASWAHTPSNTTLIWLCVSLPLVAWDAGYVMLRPWSMPGGALHWPMWAPYELYGKVDYIYGVSIIICVSLSSSMGDGASEQGALRACFTANTRIKTVESL